MLSFYKFNKDVGCPYLPYTKALVYVLVVWRAIVALLHAASDLESNVFAENLTLRWRGRQKSNLHTPVTVLTTG